MTRYCVDPDRNELTAAWGTGEGDLTTRIAVLPGGTDIAASLRLARALTQLSEAAWHTYTHPASAADSLEPNSEGWRREQERQAFSEVTKAITQPNLPQTGPVIVSYSPLIESAHQVGRALHTLDNPDLTKAVLAETAIELAAVESAELGNLTGRAQQAVLLSREDVSPVQVAAADHLLEQDPFGPAALFSDVDPTAASVAAAHWLAAAAEVAADASGQNPTAVLLEADDIEALPHETPTLVLELLDSGASPNDAVTTLVRHAMHVADGLLPDPTALREQLDDFEETLAEYAGDEPDIEDVALRLTPLDPKRPARDLLEDLLAGIHGCWLLHSEYDELDNKEEDDTENDEEREAEAHQHHSPARFAQLVRAAATRNHDRLI
ncbi:hypothetical protein [Kitasatospora cathayae]|uniref:Uncharacterized protein n=1 Tax=Kitasatospora cathayae TaxID=3004092 RepID=A0ABY7Q168_9ACTN|nr:hypothetical protein [Kitasatospora sp. HUAS 3-15]WBP86366.1 hypothetical protein O1G21_11275 [Kitasatospora sp. HUAS 3-15]